jgi:glycosyltransferase involved in cell wall biosynthesis
MSDHVIAINDLIGNYARDFNSSVSIVPNFVDTDVYRPGLRSDSARPRIVWTGSVSTLRNLHTIAMPLRQLQNKYETQVRVIANGETQIEGVNLDLREWSAEAEITNLQDCDIGIVPLLDLDWNPWKFFLKTVQYMAVGLPVVARNMGSNREVIKDGVNGFLVETEQEWFDRLSLLIENKELRLKMGEAARQTALNNYSMKTQINRVVEIFEQVYGGRH